MPWWGELIVGLVVLLGLVGVVVPVLPGSALIATAVAVWAIVESTTTGWVVLGVVLVLLAAGGCLKYLAAGRSMTRSGVPGRTLTVAGVAGLVGFFVIPVIGLPLVFVGVIYLMERLRLDDEAAARRSTVAALKAVGLAILIELAVGLASAVVWLVAAVTG